MKRVTLYGTKEGKLFIKPEELLSLKRVQELIEKVSKWYNQQNKS